MIWTSKVSLYGCGSASVQLSFHSEGDFSLSWENQALLLSSACFWFVLFLIYMKNPNFKSWL